MCGSCNILQASLHSHSCGNCTPEHQRFQTKAFVWTSSDVYSYIGCFSSFHVLILHPFRLLSSIFLFPIFLFLAPCSLLLYFHVFVFLFAFSMTSTLNSLASFISLFKISCYITIIYLGFSIKEIIEISTVSSLIPPLFFSLSLRKLSKSKSKSRPSLSIKIVYFPSLLMFCEEVCLNLLFGYSNYFYYSNSK